MVVQRNYKAETRKRRRGFLLASVIVLLLSMWVFALKIHVSVFDNQINVSMVGFLAAFLLYLNSFNKKIKDKAS